jgi:hypothetical protein
MGIFRQRPAPEPPPLVYRQCPGCDYDLVTGVGSKSCGWYDCPYLPEELKVFCPDCNHNFATGEGAPWCGEPPNCRWAAEGYQHAQNARRFQADQHRPAPVPAIRGLQASSGRGGDREVPER